jgi:hypothetical protein
LKTFRIFSILFLLCFRAIEGCGAAYTGPLKEGDIVFQDLACSQSEAIKLATHSPYSHVGIVLFKGKKPYVYEAVGPVKFTALKDWIAQGEGAHYVARRLKKADSILTPAVLLKMELVAGGFKGKAYDWTFEWSDDQMYCSELVWKIYQRATGLEIGRLQKLKEFDFSNPLVREQLKDKYGDDIPWNETVISPAQMFNSGLLTTVAGQ